MIALIVWAVLLFFSVTTSIETHWIERLTSLQAPIRVTPTEAYFRSHAYLVDLYSASSNYRLKTLGEKALAFGQSPYNPDVDPELPPHLMSSDEALIDPLFELHQTLQELKVIFQDYEVASALLRLASPQKGTCISQMCYLLSLSDKNPNMKGVWLEKTPISTSYPAIYLPKQFLKSGAQLGDKGTLSYASPTLTGSLEQEIEVEVGGFFDPGLFPMAARALLVDPTITHQIAHTHLYSPIDSTPNNGLFVWPSSLAQTALTKKLIEAKLEEKKALAYWQVTTYEDFEGAKELFQQFQGDKLLGLILGSLLFLVAAFNLVALLMLLIHNKQQEIVILVAMGANQRDIISIFAFVGGVIGLISTGIGAGLTYLTLKLLPYGIPLLAKWQSSHHPLLANPSLLQHLYFTKELWILVLFPILALGAASLPAFYASRIHLSRPS
jgi:hypothetical protein